LKLFGEVGVEPHKPAQVGERMGAGSGLRGPRRGTAVRSGGSPPIAAAGRCHGPR